MVHQVSIRHTCLPSHFVHEVTRTSIHALLLCARLAAVGVGEGPSRLPTRYQPVTTQVQYSNMTCITSFVHPHYIQAMMHSPFPVAKPLCIGNPHIVKSLSTSFHFEAASMPGERPNMLPGQDLPSLKQSLVHLLVHLEIRRPWPL